jgi:hypothetical protein
MLQRPAKTPWPPSRASRSPFPDHALRRLRSAVVPCPARPLKSLPADESLFPGRASSWTTPSRERRNEELARHRLLVGWNVAHYARSCAHRGTTLPQLLDQRSGVPRPMPHPARLSMLCLESLPIGRWGTCLQARPALAPGRVNVHSLPGRGGGSGRRGGVAAEPRRGDALSVDAGSIRARRGPRALFFDRSAERDSDLLTHPPVSAGPR